jgi:hypothetical protein
MRFPTDTCVKFGATANSGRTNAKSVPHDPGTPRLRTFTAALPFELKGVNNFLKFKVKSLKIKD